jgi:surface protein
MAVKLTSRDNIGTSQNRFTLGVPDESGWVRPSDWLPLPAIGGGEQKFVGLHAIFPEGNNFCTVRFTTSTGQYQVDWGDGSSPTLHNSNTTAEYTYDYSTYDTGNTTLTSRGYKQAIVTVTPVSGNFTGCDFRNRFTGQNQAYSTGWLDVTLSLPNAGSGGTVQFGGVTVRHSYVERAIILTIGACTSIVSMFNNCRSLQSVPLFNTASVTSMGSMFQSCTSLQSVPFFNTANVTVMSGMFSGCSSLRSVPLFNTSSVTTMASMFSTCSLLRSVPLFNTSSVTTMASMFLNCFLLEFVPLFSTATVTNMESMFNSCQSLQNIPALSTAAITTTAGSDFGVNFAVNCNSLDRCEMIFARAVGFANAQMSRDALVEIFNNLVDRTGVASAVITITNNYGAAALSAADRLIATNKNWTITG